MGKKKKNSTIELELEEIRPLTDNQGLAFKSKKNLVLYGAAGSGKTMVSCYLALKDIADNKYESLTIVRSAVPSRDIGHLPGNILEKTQIYEEPYYAICSEIFKRGDAYEVLKKKNIVNFLSTSFLRGLTVLDSVVLIEECQNLSFQELNTIMTRIGEGCRVIFSGDFKQSDLNFNGLKDFFNILSNMEKDFEFIEFTSEDIVRSGLVKRYLQTIEKLETLENA